LQLIDTVNELLVVIVADGLDLGFAIGGDMIEGVDERCDLRLRFCTFEKRYQLVDIVCL
jgi:hypothetical protein